MPRAACRRAAPGGAAGRTTRKNSLSRVQPERARGLLERGIQPAQGDGDEQEDDRVVGERDDPSGAPESLQRLAERRPRVARDEQRHGQRGDEQQRPDLPSRQPGPLDEPGPGDADHAAIGVATAASSTVWTSRIDDDEALSAASIAENPPWKAWTIVTPTGNATRMTTTTQIASSPRGIPAIGLVSERGLTSDQAV